MIDLDNRYESYLHTDKCFTINGSCERVLAYGWTDNGSDIDGYYVLTNNHKLRYNLQEQCVSIEQRIGV